LDANDKFSVPVGASEDDDVKVVLVLEIDVLALDVLVLDDDEVVALDDASDVVEVNDEEIPATSADAAADNVPVIPDSLVDPLVYSILFIMNEDIRKLCAESLKGLPASGCS